jgi:hypothetical protein
MANDAARARQEHLGKALAELYRVAPLLPAETAAFQLILDALWEGRPKDLQSGALSINEMRWMAVRAQFYLGTPYSKVFERASAMLADTEAAGTAKTIRLDYEAWEASLPPQQRRPKTYRPPPKPLCPICDSRRLWVDMLLREGTPPETVFGEASKRLNELNRHYTHIAAGSEKAIRQSYERRGCSACSVSVRRKKRKSPA